MPRLEKATITNTVTGKVIAVLFNPEEYTVNSEVTYAQSAIPGVSGPLLQFVHGNMATLEMELLLDTQEAHARAAGRNGANSDVRVLVRAITDLMAIESDHPRAAGAAVHLGVADVHLRAGPGQPEVPVVPADRNSRASRMQVTFNEFRNIDLEAKEIKRQTADYTKRRRGRPGRDAELDRRRRSTTTPPSGGRWPWPTRSRIPRRSGRAATGRAPAALPRPGHGKVYA